ncbi:MAG: NAD(P)-binding protein [Helicobacteraceae bacterium]|nr:NAD(P)-binding protein [Helicobacteraceae bacterium]
MREFDVCIVGSGAGGSPIAYELSRAGFSVVVLEKGNYLNENDFNKDELSVSRRSIYLPSQNDEYHMVNDGESIQKTSADGWNFWNGNIVGGSSNLMSGYFHKMRESDFKLKSKYGSIEGANIVDWPISLKELEPYYKKVVDVVGVSGEGMELNALAENGSTAWFDRACKKLNYTSVITPRAILSSAREGRSSCYYSNFCGSYGCSSGAKGSSRASLLNVALKTNKLTILANSFVYKLDSNSSGKVTLAHYYDKANKSQTIKAKIFVVSAQAHESVRLLLNSKGKYAPNGLGNENNQVGRNLIFSAGGSGEGRFELDNLSKSEQIALMQRGAFFNRSLTQWHEYKDNGTLYKGGVIDFLFEHANPIAKSMRSLYDDRGNISWGVALQKRIHDSFTKSKILTYEVFNDWLPTDKCYVDVDQSNKDKWGVNVGRINLNAHEHDLRVGNFLAQKSENVLKEMGAVDISRSISSSPPANLIAGGCRFGNEAKNSVLDRNCKVHDMQNLYVVDASFMPTGGSVPFTWTIYANSFRVADEILRNLRS